MTHRILEREVVLAKQQLTRAEAALHEARARFDAALTPEAMRHQWRDEQDAASRLLLAAELRAVAYRRKLHEAREAMEFYRAAKAA